MYELLCEFVDTFLERAHDLRRVKHQINTRDAVPIRQPPHRLPFSKRDEAKKVVGNVSARSY